MIQFLMIFHALVTPTIASLIMYNWRWAGMLAFSSVFSFWCINYIAMEIEMPFGNHYNNLPVCQMQRSFNETLLISTHHYMQRPPSYDPRGKPFSQPPQEVDMSNARQSTRKSAKEFYRLDSTELTARHVDSGVRMQLCNSDPPNQSKDVAEPPGQDYEDFVHADDVGVEAAVVLQSDVRMRPAEQAVDENLASNVAAISTV